MQRGVFGLWDSTKTIKGVTFAAGISGLGLSVKWSDYQPTSGAINWALLDLRLDEMLAQNLQATLWLDLAPYQCPLWAQTGSQLISLMDTNPYHSTYGENISGPVFWDPTYLANKFAFIAAAGARYAGNPNIVGVNCTFCGWHDSDWNIPTFKGTLHGNHVNQVDQWVQAGYTTVGMENVFIQTLAATASAFPTQSLKLPINPDSGGLDTTPTTLASLALTNGYGGQWGSQFYGQSNNLHVTSPLAPPSGGVFQLLYERAPAIGMQMLASCSAKNNARQNGGKNGPPLTVCGNSINVALSYKPVYLEFWSQDSDYSAFGPLFESAAATMATN